MADDALNEVLLREPVELAIDVGHKFGNLLLVHLHLLQVVNHLIELFLADLLTRGHHTLLKLLADDALYLTHLDALAQVDDGDAGTRLAGSPRASTAMGIALDVVGQAVVDDVCQVVHVQSAGSDIRSHQQLQMAHAELLHHQVTLCLRKLAMQRVGIVALLHQLVGYLLRFFACTTEDDGVDIGIEIHHALQGGILILGMHAVGYMLHVGGALVPPADGNLLGLSQVVLGDAGYLGTHRGREEQRVALGGYRSQDGVDAVGKAHVEHLVSLVEHHVLHSCQRHGATLHQVNQSARRSHDEMHASLQGLDLALDG